VRQILSAGLFLIATLLAINGNVRAQVSQEEQRKRDLFLRSREDIRPVPRATPTPAKPVPAPTAQQAPPKPTPRATATPPPRITPTPTPRASTTPSPAVTPTPRPTPTAQPPVTPRTTPSPRPKPVPRATPTPQPKATAAPKSKPAPSAPIHIEKSGKQADEGFVPPAKTGGLFRGPRYRYLTPAIRRAIDSAPVKRGRWKYIIIHNSGTRQGNAKAFDNYHKKVRKMPNGLAYHFVIGNGTSSGNGEIEIGNRWTRQINGGHVASDYLNNIAIGVCFVGDFNRDVPNKAQVQALEELVTYLRSRVGRIQGKLSAVRGHRQINPKPTDCPGNRFPLKWLNQRFKD
jgi:hypothetical protein